MKLGRKFQMSDTLPSHLEKRPPNTTELGEKDKQIKKLQAELLKLEIKISELERETIQLNRELLNYMSTQLDFKHMIDGGYDG